MEHGALEVDVSELGAEILTEAQPVLSTNSAMSEYEQRVGRRMSSPSGDLDKLSQPPRSSILGDRASRRSIGRLPRGI